MERINGQNGGTKVFSELFFGVEAKQGGNNINRERNNGGERL